MTVSRQDRLSARRAGHAVLCFSALATGVLAAPGRAEDAGAVINVEGPAGFESLARAQDMLVDVYFGGVRVGEARVVAEPGAVTFVEPEALITLLPKLADRSVVAAALGSAKISSNPHLACGQGSDPSECGRLRPDIAGVILDRDSFRIDVFVNPRFLAVTQDESDFLAAPPGDLTLFNTFGAVLSGQSGARSDYYTLQNAVIVGAGDKRVRSTLTYANGLGFQVPELTAEWDRPGIRFLAGALQAPGGDFGARYRIVGVGAQSQIDTRLDRDELIGSPLIAFLDRRSRVDVLVDGRIVHSAIYDPGNQRIDTASLPFGSYDVVLRIQEPAGPPREERRLFSKNLRVPSLGRTDFFAFGGMISRARAWSALEPSGKPYIQAAVAHRVNEHWALEGLAQSADQNHSAQFGATFLASFASFRAAAFIDARGNSGGLLQVASSGVSPLNFHFDIRRFSGSPSGTLDPLQLGPSADTQAGQQNPQTYTQASGVVSYAHANVRVLGTLALRQTGDDGLRYSIGPSIEWDVLRKGPLSVALRSDIVLTDEGEAAFAGLSLRFTGARTLFSSSTGARHSSIASDSRGSGFEAAVRGALTTSLGEGDLSLGAGYDRQPNERNAVVTADLRHSLGSVVGDFVRSDNGVVATNQYSLGVQSTLVAGPGGATLAGRTTSESMVVAHLRGATAADKFQILVNDQVAGAISGNEATKLALPSYRQYDIRIRSVGGSLTTYDTASRRVILYPGSVAKVDWDVSPVSILFGQLLAPDGRPVANATISGRATWAETDANGHFQLETSLGTALTVLTAEGTEFALDLSNLPASQTAGHVIRLGSIRFNPMLRDPGYAQANAGRR
jgi:Mat/Ecp fimbriae outer membrane usher protein